MNKETLDEFIERQCELAYEDGDNGKYQYPSPQAEEIKWAVNQYIQTNFKEEK